MSETPSEVARECRFAVHVPGGRDRPDLHLVKEVIHQSDGSTIPKLRWIKDFKRQFYVSMPTHRSYKQKKEYEEMSKLSRYECTQSEMQHKVASALGTPYSNDHLKKLSNSPYLYGTEIRSTSIIKKAYQKKNTTHLTPFSVMSFDIETDMVHGHGDPIIITAAMGKEVYLIVTEEYLQGFANPEAEYREGCQKYITEFVDLTGYQLIFVTAKDTVDMIRKFFAYVHSKMPDFLAVWNVDFDIPRILATLEKYDVDPREILCDPSVPFPARICKYRQGLKKKRKANGQEVPIDVADQWHSLTLTASFFVIDAMCVYRLMRLAKEKDSSYSLDAILEKELGARKIRFKEAEAYKKDRWHTFMQSNYKIQYLVYAMFDSLSMILLDEKTMDLKSKFPGYADITDFARANSKPKLIADALYYYALERGLVLCSVGEDDSSFDEDEEDDENPATLGLKGWINR